MCTYLFWMERLWVIEQVHSGICELGQFDTANYNDGTTWFLVITENCNTSDVERNGKKSCKSNLWTMYIFRSYSFFLSGCWISHNNCKQGKHCMLNTGCENSPLRIWDRFTCIISLYVLVLKSRQNAKYSKNFIHCHTDLWKLNAAK